MMMIAKYKGNFYNYSCEKEQIDWNHNVAINCGKSYLSTRRLEKQLSGFIKRNDIMYMKIDEQSLSDIFYIEYIVGYDTDLPSIPTEWIVQDIIDEKIKVEYGLGHLPGWSACDKYTSFNLIDKDDIKSSKLQYVYTKKDGIKYSEPVVDEKRVDIDELIRVYREYWWKNL